MVEKKLKTKRIDSSYNLLAYILSIFIFEPQSLSLENKNNLFEQSLFL